MEVEMGRTECWTCQRERACLIHPPLQTKQEWYREQAEYFGGRTQRGIRWDLIVTPDSVYHDARLAAHFGRLALGQTDEQWKLENCWDPEDC